MRHSTTFLMSLIVASILVLMFLNLVLGSVSIPLKSVWNIICGLGDEPVTWQNIVWKSRLPQALTALVAGAGLAISGLQMQTVFRNPLAGPSVLGISSGASMGVAFVVLLSGSSEGLRLVNWVYGRNCAFDSSRDRFALGDGVDRICVAEGEGERDAADYRRDDRLRGECGDRRAEVLQRGGGYSRLCDLGVRQLLTCFRQPDDAVCCDHGDSDPFVVPVDQDVEPDAAWRRLCP